MTPLGIGLTVCALVGAALAWLFWLAWKAPLGWEDSDGFHLGEPDEHASDDNLGI